jgi:hypothetical protein
LQQLYLQQLLLLGFPKSIKILDYATNVALFRVIATIVAEDRLKKPSYLQNF